MAPNAAKARAQWEKNYRSLRAFKEERDNCDVPTKSGPLGDWVDWQRKQHRRGKLSLDRKARLDEIGFAWNVRDAANEEAWEENFRSLVEYREVQGHCNVSKRDGPLGEWVKWQRRCYKAGKLAEDRIQRLEELGLEWALGRRGAATSRVSEDENAGAQGGGGSPEGGEASGQKRDAQPERATSTRPQLSRPERALQRAKELPRSEAQETRDATRRGEQAGAAKETWKRKGAPAEGGKRSDENGRGGRLSAALLSRCAGHRRAAAKEGTYVAAAIDSSVAEGAAQAVARRPSSLEIRSAGAPGAAVSAGTGSAAQGADGAEKQQPNERCVEERNVSNGSKKKTPGKSSLTRADAKRTENVEGFGKPCESDKNPESRLRSPSEINVVSSFGRSNDAMGEEEELHTMEQPKESIEIKCLKRQLACSESEVESLKKRLKDAASEIEYLKKGVARLENQVKSFEESSTDMSGCNIFTLRAQVQRGSVEADGREDKKCEREEITPFVYTQWH